MNANNTIFTPMAGKAVTAAFTSTAADTAAMPAGTTAAWCVSSSDAFVRVGATAVANQDMYLPAGFPVVLACVPGSVISAVQMSASGTLYVCPIA